MQEPSSTKRSHHVARRNTIGNYRRSNSMDATCSIDREADEEQWRALRMLAHAQKAQEIPMMPPPKSSYRSRADVADAYGMTRAASASAASMMYMPPPPQPGIDPRHRVPAAGMIRYGAAAAPVTSQLELLRFCCFCT